MSQIASYGLFPIRQKMTNPSGHTPVINISDSNGEQGRWFTAVRLAFEVIHKYIPISPNTGFTGAASGTSTQYVDVGGAAHDGANFVPGDSILGTSGLLTGLASNRYEYPVRGLKSIWTADPTTPHFSRLLVQMMTHGTTMQNGDGTTPATYALGDPTTGDDIRFGFACLGNVNGNTWSEQLATDVDPQGDSTWQDTVTAGYGTDATVPATDLGIVVYERATPVTQSAVGMSARIKHTATDEATDRTGRQLYITDTWFENTEVDDGLSFWTWSIGGWNTTDHMPPVVNGNANADAKWDTDRAIEWVQKVARSTSGYIIFRIQMGQNDVGAGGDFGEGSGTNIENYPLNIEAIVTRCRTIAEGASLTPLIYLVAPQNTISGGARFEALATALRALAVSTNIGFFDLRGALIDGGYTDGNDLMLSSISSDGIHAGQLGASVFGALEWGAISTALKDARGTIGTRGTRGSRSVRGVR